MIYCIKKGGFIIRCQIITDLLNNSSLIISILALIISTISYKYNKNRGKIEKAINLANKYQELIKEISIIVNILKVHQEVYDISTNSISEDSIKDFTQNEAKKLYKSEHFTKLYEFHKGNGMDVRLLKNNYFLNLLSSSNNTMGFMISTNSDSDSSYDNVIKKYYKGKIDDVLNSLEAFSMAFVQNVADEEVVYQSLHQSYIKIVKLLYFRIAYANNKPSDKYYTNIIELYKRWRKKQQISQYKIDKNNKKALLISEKIKKKAEDIKPKVKL